MQKIFFLFLLIWCSSAIASSQEIPDSFLGRWGETIDSCTAEFPVYVFRIEPTEVFWWEQHGTVIRISGSSTKINVTFLMSGEGEEWQANSTFTLASEKKYLTTEMEHGKYEYVRCE